MAWTVRRKYDFPMGSAHLLISKEDTQSGKLLIAEPFVWSDFDPYTTWPPDRAPTLAGHDVTAFLQAAMDEAYEAGLRPSRAQDERQLKAHLTDMRAIAFHAIGAPKP